MLFQSRSICDRNTSIGEKAYGNEAVNRSNLCRQYSRFGDGRGLVEDGETDGRPKSTSTAVNIAAVADLVNNDRQFASRIIAVTNLWYLKRAQRCYEFWTEP
jgi:hypothetical protein